MAAGVSTAVTAALLATDRCDRCGAQAHASATLTAGPLLFCSHHYREHWESLLLADADIVLDDTLRLTYSGGAVGRLVQP